MLNEKWINILVNLNNYLEKNNIKEESFYDKMISYTKFPCWQFWNLGGWGENEAKEGEKELKVNTKRKGCVVNFQIKA